MASDPILNEDCGSGCWRRAVVYQRGSVGDGWTASSYVHHLCTTSDVVENLLWPVVGVSHIFMCHPHKDEGKTMPLNQRNEISCMQDEQDWTKDLSLAELHRWAGWKMTHASHSERTGSGHRGTMLKWSTYSKGQFLALTENAVINSI